VKNPSQGILVSCDEKRNIAFLRMLNSHYESESRHINMVEVVRYGDTLMRTEYV